MSSGVSTESSGRGLANSRIDWLPGSAGGIFVENHRSFSAGIRRSDRIRIDSLQKVIAAGDCSHSG